MLESTGSMDEDGREVTIGILSLGRHGVVMDMTGMGGGGMAMEIVGMGGGGMAEATGKVNCICAETSLSWDAAHSQNCSPRDENIISTGFASCLS